MIPNVSVTRLARIVLMSRKFERAASRPDKTWLPAAAAAGVEGGPSLVSGGVGAPPGGDSAGAIAALAERRPGTRRTCGRHVPTAAVRLPPAAGP